MKKIILSVCVTFCILFSMPALAFKSSQFKGWYKVISRQDVSSKIDHYLMIDVDTLGAIWKKYADGPLPPDLEKYREEPTILAGYTDRELYFLGFEKAALVGDNYLSLHGGDTDQMELKRRADGNFDMAVKDRGHISVYLLGAPKENPDSLKKR